MPNIRQTSELPPSVALLQMMMGYRVSQAIYIAAKLGIADLLDAGPLHGETLAVATGTHAPSLYRLLRALATVGVFVEMHTGSFGLTPTAALLQTDHPNSMRAMAVKQGEEQYQVWGDMLRS